MSSRPGGQELTRRGLELAGVREGSRLLDIGCGSGETVAWLKASGMKAEGIDINLEKISQAKEAYPDIDVKFGDGELLDAYLSFTFDGILMEGVLSQIHMPDEALHEAWCVMKKGGKLIISDLYEKNPDRRQMQAVRLEAERRSKIPHTRGDCEELGMKYVDFRWEGAFYEQPLIRQLEEIGFHIIAFRDCQEELDAYLRQEDVPDGAPEAPGDAEPGRRGEDIARRRALTRINRDLKTEVDGKARDIGYFLLAAAKPL